MQGNSLISAWLWTCDSHALFRWVDWSVGSRFNQLVSLEGLQAGLEPLTNTHSGARHCPFSLWLYLSRLVACLALLLVICHFPDRFLALQRSLTVKRKIWSRAIVNRAMENSDWDSLLDFLLQFHSILAVVICVVFWRWWQEVVLQHHSSGRWSVLLFQCLLVLEVWLKREDDLLLLFFVERNLLRSASIQGWHLHYIRFSPLRRQFDLFIYLLYLWLVHDYLAYLIQLVN